jgi:hypothetical protein
MIIGAMIIGAMIMAFLLLSSFRIFDARVAFVLV